MSQHSSLGLSVGSFFMAICQGTCRCCMYKAPVPGGQSIPCHGRRPDTFPGQKYRSRYDRRQDTSRRFLHRRQTVCFVPGDLRRDQSVLHVSSQFLQSYGKKQRFSEILPPLPFLRSSYTHRHALRIHCACLLYTSPSPRDA